MVKTRSVQNPLDWSFLEYLRSGKTRQKAPPEPAAEAPRPPWVLEDWVSLHTAGPTRGSASLRPGVPAPPGSAALRTPRPPRKVLPFNGARQMWMVCNFFNKGRLL